MTDSLIRELLRNGAREVLESVVRERSIRQLACNLNISCQKEEIQSEANSFRIENDLIDPDSTTRWLKSHGMTARNWTKQIEVIVLESKIKKSLVDNGSVAAAFSGSGTNPQEILSAWIILEHEGLAQEIYWLITEEEYSFDIMIRRYSIESVINNKMTMLTRRRVYSDELPFEALNLIKQNSQDYPIVFKPISIDGYWYIYSIYDVRSATFDKSAEDFYAKKLIEYEIQALMYEQRSKLFLELIKLQ